MTSQTTWQLPLGRVDLGIARRLWLTDRSNVRRIDASGSPEAELPL